MYFLRITSLLLLSLIWAACSPAQPKSSITPCPPLIEGCPFQFLCSKEVITVNGNRTSITAEGKAALEGNVTQLIEGEIGLELETEYENWKDVHEQEQLNYPDTFLAKHNILVQILCDLYSERHDTNLSDSMRKESIREYRNKRSDYFYMILQRPKPALPDPGRIEPSNPMQTENEIKTPLPPPTKMEELPILMGKVLDDQNKRLEGVLVYDEFGNQTRTDSNGRFTLTIDSKGAALASKVKISYQYGGVEKSEYIKITNNPISLKL